MTKEKHLSCIDCTATGCQGDHRIYPDFCLTAKLNQDQIDQALKCYEQEDNKKAMIAAAEVETEGYCRDCRVEEVINFAQKIGATKLGIATCVGLIKESNTLARILRSHGFQVYGAACKVGSIAKSTVGIHKSCEELGRSMCNPILQAQLLNEEDTDLNLVMGLCIGHDSLFYKYSQALTTTVVTKDRVLGHNPAAALYTSGTYYKKLIKTTR